MRHLDPSDRVEFYHPEPINLKEAVRRGFEDYRKIWLTFLLCLKRNNIYLPNHIIQIIIFKGTDYYINDFYKMDKECLELLENIKMYKIYNETSHTFYIRECTGYRKNKFTKYGRWIEMKNNYTGKEIVSSMLRPLNNENRNHHMEITIDDQEDPIAKIYYYETGLFSPNQGFLKFGNGDYKLPISSPRNQCIVRYGPEYRVYYRCKVEFEEKYKHPKYDNVYTSDDEMFNIYIMVKKDHTEFLMQNLEQDDLSTN